MPIIDFHVHFHKREWEKGTSFLVFNYGGRDYTELTLLKNMSDSNIITQSVVFGLPDKYVDTEKANRYALSMTEKIPNKFISFAIVDDKPEFWVDEGVKGFKEHSYGQINLNNGFKKANLFYKTYEVAAEKGLPLLLHAGRDRVQRVQDILQQFPTLKIVLAHLGADFEPTKNYRPDQLQIYSTLQALRDTAVCFDTSAIKDANILRESIKLLGSERFLFGSDFPEEHPKLALARIKSLDLQDKDLENILYNNAQRILRC